MLKIWFLLFLGLVGQTAYSQKVYHHGVFWARLVLADKISNKLRWELYLQQRTQNKAPGEPNIFEAPHFSSVWAWLHYSATKNIKLSVSPFGYFKSNLFNTTAADTELPGVQEFRWCLRAETKQELNYVQLFNRYNLEYRWRDLQNNGTYQPNYRVRYMARVEKPVIGIFSKEKPVTFFVADELFIQFGPAVKDNPNVFDQNRFNIGFNYEVFKNIKVSISYLNIYQQRISGLAFDSADAFWIVLTFDNLFTQFLKANSTKI